MKTYLLTLDYELRGDGTGSIFDQMITPTQKILDLCDRNGAKLTIFFEVIEYMKIKEQWEQGNSMGYSENPLLAIEKQLKNAIADGHDVQLHLHPQWCRAKWCHDHWVLDDENWHLGDYLPLDGITLDSLFEDGKKLLESWFIPISPNYRCLALRAGGYNILPCEKIIQSMNKHGFVLDSSIYNGGYEDRFLFRYDFRSITNISGYWPFSSDVRISDVNGNLYELPVLAIPMKRFVKYFRWEKLFNAWQNFKRVKTTVAEKPSSSSKKFGMLERLFSKIKFFWEMDSQNWDMTVITPGMQKKFLRLADQLEKQYQRKVFTIIGHPKCLKSTDTLQHLLKQTMQKRNCNFMTLTDFYRAGIMDRRSKHIESNG